MLAQALQQLGPPLRGVARTPQAEHRAHGSRPHASRLKQLAKCIYVCIGYIYILIIYVYLCILIYTYVYLCILVLSYYVLHVTSVCCVFF